MSWDYDGWLLRQADKYWEPCEPEIIKAEKVYENDGYSMDYTYNCQMCDNTECENWREYNEVG